MAHPEMDVHKCEQNQSSWSPSGADMIMRINSPYHFTSFQ
jgi:hypothetical protein